jgi:hypothetical protein
VDAPHPSRRDRPPGRGARSSSFDETSQHPNWAVPIGDPSDLPHRGVELVQVVGLKLHQAKVAEPRVDIELADLDVAAPSRRLQVGFRVQPPVEVNRDGQVTRRKADEPFVGLVFPLDLCVSASVFVR